MPESNGSILRCRTDEGQLGMEHDTANIVRVSIEGVHNTLGLIIPNLDSAIIGPRQDVGLVTTGIVINAVDSALMSLKSVMWHRTAESPYFDAPIQTG